MSSYWRLACGWLTLFVVGTDLFIVSPLLPSIAVTFGLSDATAGLSVTVFSLTYLVSAPLLGRFADRIGRRHSLLACLFGFGLANVFTAVAPGFSWLLVARVIAGATAAGISPIIYAGVGEAAPADRRATWMSIAVSGLLLAISVGAPAGAMIANRWDWRAPFLAIAVLSLALIVANRVVWPADPRRGGKSMAPTSTGNYADITLFFLSVFAQFFFPAQQASLGSRFPQCRIFILALNNSALFLGISLGSLIGGQAMVWSGFAGNAALATAIASFAWIFIAKKIYRRVAEQKIKAA